MKVRGSLPGERLSAATVRDEGEGHLEAGAAEGGDKCHLQSRYPLQQRGHSLLY